VIQAPFADVLSFAGYPNGTKVWDDPAPMGSCNHDQDVLAEMGELF